MMLSNINLARTEIAYLSLSKDEILNRLNYIDLCALIENVAERFADNLEELRVAGTVITFMLSKGLFDSCKSIDENERAEHLDKLFSVFDELMQSGDVDVDERETKWWDDEVIQYCKVGLNEKQRVLVREALEKAKSINGTSGGVNDLAEHLDKAGTYFLYTYFTEEQLRKLPKRFRQRKNIQMRVYHYDLQLWKVTYGKGEQAFEQTVRAGVIRQLGDQPENICRDIIEGKRDSESIGITPEILAILIDALVSILLAVINAIANAVAKVYMKKYEAVTEEDIDLGCPQGSDMKNVKKAGLGSNTLLLAAGAALLYTVVTE